MEKDVGDLVKNHRRQRHLEDEVKLSCMKGTNSHSLEPKSEKFFGALKVCPHQKLEIDAGANFNQSLRLDRRKVSLILRWKSVIL